ncbi:unnamed protein product [Ceutorhynchus assimilis]|uniref:Uncharacterized protein n=1 Tax=Ceutorhynchus assimilis TaxID=467358 RepID=A0A9N9MWT7_9CUCU|nr:unnamed protein product [Ceutorhynchus assimilis]
MIYSVNLDPTTQTSLKMQLFNNVTNTAELRSKIMTGELKCCIVKPQLVYDPLQVVVAANKALTSKKQTTKSIFTELLFNLSPSSNISQSLLKFGIHDKDQSLLVVILEKTTDNFEDIFSLVQGDVLDISHLNQLNDIKAIRKMYKITDKEFNSVDILDSIVSRIATKE